MTELIRAYDVLVVSNGVAVVNKRVHATGWVIEDHMFIFRDREDKTVFASPVAMLVITSTADEVPDDRYRAGKIGAKDHEQL